MPKISFEKITLELVEQLPLRAKDVVAERFGLNDNAPQTLQAVGQNHDITRERVRQIVEEGLHQLRENARQERRANRVAFAFAEIAQTLKNAGSMKREDLLLELLEAREEANHALFLLTLGDQFYDQRETQDFYPFWALRKDLVQKAKPWHERLLDFFRKKKNTASDQELRALHGKDVFCYLEVAKDMERGPEGDWGLRTWPEVNPRGMRDKAYLVLKKTGTPLHFREVAKEIEKMQERLVLQRRKEVLPQTVHNELIKNSRFVLIGRGTYGLSDWGLAQGTVKDVMCSILASNGKTMDKAKLITETLLQRKVKESTIALNLQDRRYFSRNQDGTYTLKPNIL